MPGKALLDINISDDIVPIIKGHENAMGDKLISGKSDDRQ